MIKASFMKGNTTPSILLAARSMTAGAICLAGNKTVYQIGIELQEVKNPQTIALTLNVVLGLDYSKVLAAASMPASKDAVYAVVTDFVTPDKVEHLNQLAQQIVDTYNGSHDKNPPSLAGLKTVPHLMRSYPEKDVASNILGFVSRDNKGYFGVEEKYNELLAGKPKTVWMPLDPNRVSELPDVPDGASLVLTLDRAIQSEMENILDKAIQNQWIAVRHNRCYGSQNGRDPGPGDYPTHRLERLLDLLQYL